MNDKQKKVNEAVQAFLENFKANPLAHRCEHSLHIDLYNELRKKIPDEDYVICTDKKTRLVHKEWPGRPEQDSHAITRTNVDVVLLKEVDNKLCVYSNPTIEDFHVGNFAIDYAFELSLNYGIGHLCWDLFKILTCANKAEHFYIVHLYNNNHRKMDRDSCTYGLPKSLIQDCVSIKNSEVKTDIKTCFSRIIKYAYSHNANQVAKWNEGKDVDPSKIADTWVSEGKNFDNIDLIFCCPATGECFDSL